MSNKFVQLLRPHHYVKNVFIFAPLFFGLKFDNIGLLVKSAYAFAAFCAVASAAYAFNDIFDAEEDRLHPDKMRRPVASGAITVPTAAAISGAALLCAMLLATAAGDGVWRFILFYATLNIAYTLRLKHVPILDVSVIAVGFVLRLFTGASATGVPLSIWIIITTFLLSLFLALAKRRHDCVLYQKSGMMTRKVLDGYNLDFLNIAMGIMAMIVVMAYLTYTVSPEVAGRIHSDYLYLTTFFVLVGIMRYLQLAFVEENGGNPTNALLRDRFLQCVVSGWIIVFAWILYR